MYATQIFPTAPTAAPTYLRRESPVAAGATLAPLVRPPAVEATEAMRRKPSRAKQSAASRLAASLEYMQAHLDQPLRIPTLSARAGLSASRFFELFKHATGDTPLNWFIRARMTWAGELLHRSDRPIKQIAGQVGYEDQFYFSRLFKAVHGVAPSQYRAQKPAGSVA